MLRKWRFNKFHSHPSSYYGIANADEPSQHSIGDLRHKAVEL